MATMLHFFPYYVENVLDIEQQQRNFGIPGINLHEMAAWMENARQQVAEHEHEPRPTATPAELAAVQRFVVGADGCNETESECAICLERIKKGDEAAQLPCKHSFHSACIGQWLEQHDNRCPICRQELHAAQTIDKTAQLTPRQPSPAQRLGELSVRELVRLCEARGLGQAARSCLEKHELVALLTLHARRQHRMYQEGASSMHRPQGDSRH